MPTGASNTYYFKNKWRCNKGERRCNYYLSFSDKKVKIKKNEKCPWKLIPSGSGSNTFYIQNKWGCSSRKVTGKVKFYQHCNYGGYSRSFGTGNYSWVKNYNIRNDDISSIRVPAGLTAILYEHIN